MAVRKFIRPSFSTTTAWAGGFLSMGLCLFNMVVIIFVEDLYKFKVAVGVTTILMLIFSAISFKIISDAAETYDRSRKDRFRYLRTLSWNKKAVEKATQTIKIDVCDKMFDDFVLFINARTHGDEEFDVALAHARLYANETDLDELRYILDQSSTNFLTLAVSTDPNLK